MRAPLLGKSSVPLVRSLLTVSLLLVSCGAAADRTTRFNYDRSFGGGLWSVKYSPDDGDSYSMPGLMVRGAYEVSRKFAVEAHLGTTEEDTRDALGGTVPVSLRINLLGGVFAKGSLLYEQNKGWARVYGLLGVSFVEARAEAQGESAHDNDAGISYGVGLDLFGSDRTAIVLEWVRYLDTSDFKIETPMIGLLRRF